MKKDDAYDSDSCDEDYTGQPPDDDQSFIVPRRGLEPDSGSDDEPMIVERRGSPADTDSLVFEEDMYQNFRETFITFIFLPYHISKKNREEGDKNKEYIESFIKA